jgi:putative membrane-bound dehydrogenase-like protein
MFLRAATLLVFLAAAAHAADPPSPAAGIGPPHLRVAPGVRIHLLVADPDIVTPTGIDVDAAGRVWVVACHTHFRPADYPGPDHDEVLVFDPAGARRVFWSGSKATTSLLLGPEHRRGPGSAGRWVYLAERSRIIRIRDTDGDGLADEEEPIVTLDTVADYPHNGLAALAWHPEGDLVFAVGENFSQDWTLTGRDAAPLRGRGEGGVFRCAPDGRHLRRIARGVWNPFGITVRPDGEIFAVDNDPDSLPPCRLLAVVEGADFGFNRAYGTGPAHPFLAWNGELRGTLGMIHPTGEGPCAVQPLGGGLVVPSWSQHRIDWFALQRRGAGYEATRREIVSGPDDFRPACMARGPVGDFYCADWVSGSYAVHGRGRIWRFSIDSAAAPWFVPDWPPDTAASRRARDLRDPVPAGPAPARAELVALARSADPVLADAALAALCRVAEAAGPAALAALPAEERLWTLVALRKAGLDDPRWVRAVLPDASGELLFECLRWIADGRLKEFASHVSAVADRLDLDFPTFAAAQAAAAALRAADGPDPRALAARLVDPATPPRLAGYALRLLPPGHATLSAAQVDALLSRGDADLSRDVVRTLGANGGPAALPTLARIAADAGRPSDLRADATAGLAASSRAEDVALFLRLTTDAEAAVRDEALRSLRGRPLEPAQLASLAPAAAENDLAAAVLAPQSLGVGRPPFADAAAWLARLDALPSAPDPAAGRRIFFHPRVGQCGSCHGHDGRGGGVGPDLTHVGRQADRLGLLRSILEPDRDVAPQYRAHVLHLADGTSFTGILLRSSTTEVYRDPAGRERTFAPEEIETAAELPTSLMPTGLPAGLTDRELRDLLAFLAGSR